MHTFQKTDNDISNLCQSVRSGNCISSQTDLFSQQVTDHLFTDMVFGTIPRQTVTSVSRVQYLLEWKITILKMKIEMHSNTLYEQEKMVVALISVSSFVSLTKSHSLWELCLQTHHVLLLTHLIPPTVLIASKGCCVPGSDQVSLLGKFPAHFHVPYYITFLRGLRTCLSGLAVCSSDRQFCVFYFEMSYPSTSNVFFRSILVYFSILFGNVL